MSLDFLQRYGARRLTVYAPPPPPEQEEEDESQTGESIHLDLEMPEHSWRAIATGNELPYDDELPRRFVDGSYFGENVAWLQDVLGRPVPVRLAEIGGICMCADGRTLRREAAVVERVVASLLDPFPWDEVEAFGSALQQDRLQLLCLQPQRDEPGSSLDFERRELSFDFRRNSEAVRLGVLRAMADLEAAALEHRSDMPTIVDGPLGRLFGATAPEWDVIGVVKRQVGDYLHPHGYVTMLGLQPGDRTPAFEITSRHLKVISWYLKLAGGDGEMPDWGYIRVEVPTESIGRHNMSYINRLSRYLLEIRCRRNRYARGPVSLEPIVRAEESIQALFEPLNPLKQHFWRLVGI